MNRANLAWNIENQITDTEGKFAGKIYEKEVTISSAEILALYTTPKELVAAPGTNMVLQFVSAVAFLDFNATAYTTRGIVTVKTGTALTAVSDPCAAAALVQQADDCYEEINKLSTEVELEPNESLVLTCDTGNPIAGDSPLRIKTMYRILDFS